jgi:hypothetical protein
MTDDAPAFYNAFANYFDTSETKRLICMWHVERNWKKNATTKVTGIDNRKKLLTELFVLIR